MIFPNSDVLAYRPFLCSLALGWLGLITNGLTQTSAPSDTLQLKESSVLQETLDPVTRSRLPSFVSGRSISGRTDLETTVDGAAVLRKGDIVISADRLDYNQPTDLVRASGNVRINRAGNVYQGPHLELRVDAFEGFFNQPSYQFLRNEAHGQADRVEFLDDQRAVIRNATFTTCKRLPAADWIPDWILRADTISMDNAEDEGQAELAVLSFKGVPLLPVPHLTFPLSDQRKSGFLPPTVGLDNVNGFEIAQPYYWNIAPNRDATLTPTVMTRRGVNLGSEFRYLESDYSGTARFDWMPSDPLRDASRWGLNLTHQANLDSRWTDAGIALGLNLNRVSDDTYWRDFSRSNASLTQRLLANDLTLAWQNGPFSNSARVLKWQTLQDPSAAIVPPYDRLPQLTTRYAKSTAYNLNVAVEADYTQFVSDTSLTGQPNAERALAKLQIDRPLIGVAGNITPKLLLHATQYQFDTPLSTGERQVNRVVPTFSLDSTLVFERDSHFFGRNLIQTLEPRAFYVYTPFRAQNQLPNYDSGTNDFNLSTIFTENAFIGNDRISDSKLLTLGLTSRLLDPQTGAEAARLGVAQRLRFANQNVTLPGGTTVTEQISDILVGGSVNWSPRWSLDSTVQFNPHTNESIRSTLSTRYSPGSFRTVAAAYRFQRDASEQLDLSWQWPLPTLASLVESSADANHGGPLVDTGRWYSVGRLNYSVTESRLVNAVMGFEYDGGCWLGRIVLDRQQTSTATATQRIMFQLEFVGFSRLGVSPLKTLQDNIPGYQILRAPQAAPSRFSNYD